jgi:hypothetical protein
MLVLQVVTDADVTQALHAAILAALVGLIVLLRRR